MILRSDTIDRVSSEVEAPGSKKKAAHDVAAIVLAGAHRWQPHVLEDVLYPPLLPILDKPLIAHILGWLQCAGVPVAQICANSNTARLRKTFGMHGPCGIGLQYYEDVMPRGPAGCARDAASTMNAEMFVVMDATAMPLMDLDEILEAHHRTGADVTVVAHKDGHGADNASDARLTPAGMYVMNRSVFESVPDFGYQDIKEALIPSLYEQQRRICTYTIEKSTMPRIHCWASYLQASMLALRWVLDRGRLPQGYDRTSEIVAHHTARVSKSARLIGSVMVGPHSSIEGGAILTGPTVVGRGCVVRSAAITNHCVMWDDCEIDQGAIVDSSILATGSRIPAREVLRRTACLPTRAVSLAARDNSTLNAGSTKPS